MKIPVLTILIPTFSRNTRLAKNLDFLYEEIYKNELCNEIGIYISDNHSSDQTPEVCSRYSKKFEKLGIGFDYSRNQSNIGFSWNIIESYFKVKSRYTLFLSDDDNLKPGFLNQLLNDIEQYKFSVGIYNFSQPPFDGDNLFIKNTELTKGVGALEAIAHLIRWPKLSGLVLRNNHESGRHERLKSQVAQNNVVGHVILGLDQILREPILLLSNKVAAYPDDDFRDHVNFVSYIGNYIKRDVRKFYNQSGIQNAVLESTIEEIPTRNVVLSSLQTLSLYFKSQSKLSRKMRNEVFQNIIFYLAGRNISSSGLVLEKPYEYFPRTKTIFYLFYLATAAIKARISRKTLYLMDEAF